MSPIWPTRCSYAEVMSPTSEITDPKVLIVVGTRPEAIKMVPVILAFAQSSRITPIVISTGQHAELVRRVLRPFGLAPDIELNATRPGMSLNNLFSSVMSSLENYVATNFGEPPADSAAAASSGYPVTTFVHGDTSSAAAAALASFHLRIPVVHVEAGLRTSDTLSPFPEELNRQLISRIAAFHAAPTHKNRENLIHEGVELSRILVTGNTAIDALQLAVELDQPFDVPELAVLDTMSPNSRIIVVTAHRRENWGPGIERISKAVSRLAIAYPHDRFVVPLHPNPAVSSVFRTMLEQHENVLLVPSLDYLPFARLLKRAHIILTDSGGVQEEAPALGTPVLVLRDTTERSEGVKAGTVELVGTTVDRIVARTSMLLEDDILYRRRATQGNPYGDGHAAQRIVQACEFIAFGTEEPEQFGTIFDRSAVLRAGGYGAASVVAAQPEMESLDDVAFG